tara:strand:- start:179 stop:667 length:489 start_codon:yes stop_codon:yes gene_type:complete
MIYNNYSYFFYSIYLMKLKINKYSDTLYLFLFVFFGLTCIVIFTKLYNPFKKEQFNTMNDLVNSGINYEKKRNNILKHTDNLVNDINPFDINNTDSNEILNKYIDKHLFDSKKSVVPTNQGNLSNESLKTIQLIQLNELKLILEKINRIESIQVDPKYQNKK